MAHGRSTVVFRDVLYNLASIGDLPLLQPSHGPSQKRERDSDNPVGSLQSAPSDSPSDAPSPGSPTKVPGDSTRVFASNHRVPYGGHQPQIPPQQHDNLEHMSSQLQPGMTSHPSSSSMSNISDASLTLPIYSQELGSLPLHHGFSSDVLSGNMLEMPPPIASPSSSDVTMDPNAMFSMFDMAEVYSHVMAGLSETTPGGSHHYGTAALEGDFLNNSAPGNSIPMGADGAGAGGQAAFQGIDTLHMWLNAPQGFEWDDWENYISNVTGDIIPPDDPLNPSGSS